MLFIIGYDFMVANEETPQQVAFKRVKQTTTLVQLQSSLKRNDSSAYEVMFLC